MCVSAERVAARAEGQVLHLTLNRPEKRNAMNPRLNAEMVEVLETLDADDRCGVLVLTGAGDAFSIAYLDARASGHAPVSAARRATADSRTASSPSRRFVPRPT